jgi:ubiquinone/menaquinone biosynthesis C-methylase UbiE
VLTKEQVRKHWETETAGIRYGEGTDTESFYRSIEQQRYLLEPVIPSFAHFEGYAGKRILEIGIGGGVDFSRFVHHGALATGVDLTQGGIAHTLERLNALNRQGRTYYLSQADAENLPFKDNRFDLVYSWGVMHHTPDTERALAEAFRVLRQGAHLKAMIYHTPSWTGWMLWVRYALLAGRPLLSPRRCVYEQLESPGTKAYSVTEAEHMLEKLGFKIVQVTTKLGPGDLLTIKASKRYQGLAYRLIWTLYPRWLVRLLGDRFGLYLLIMAQKPLEDSQRGE